MPDVDPAQTKILEAIERLAEQTGPGEPAPVGRGPRMRAANSSHILNLAEAYAWLSNANQPHGGRADVSQTVQR